MNDDKLLTPQEVADYLDVHRETVRRWLRQGKLEGVKAGTAWRIRQEDVDRFLFDQDQEQPDSAGELRRRALELELDMVDEADGELQDVIRRLAAKLDRPEDKVREMVERAAEKAREEG